MDLQSASLHLAFPSWFCSGVSEALSLELCVNSPCQPHSYMRWALWNVLWLSILTVITPPDVVQNNAFSFLGVVRLSSSCCFVRSLLFMRRASLSLRRCFISFSFISSSSRFLDVLCLHLGFASWLSFRLFYCSGVFQWLPLGFSLVMCPGTTYEGYNCKFVSQGLMCSLGPLCLTCLVNSLLFVLFCEHPRSFLHGVIASFWLLLFAVCLHTTIEGDNNSFVPQGLWFPFGPSGLSSLITSLLCSRRCDHVSFYSPQVIVLLQLLLFAVCLLFFVIHTTCVLYFHLPLCRFCLLVVWTFCSVGASVSLWTLILLFAVCLLVIGFDTTRDCYFQLPRCRFCLLVVWTFWFRPRKIPQKTGKFWEFFRG